MPDQDTSTSADEVDAEWGGHFFPAPEELGVDAEAVAWSHGNCACGVTYTDWVTGLAPECY